MNKKITIEWSLLAAKNHGRMAAILKVFHDQFPVGKKIKAFIKETLDEFEEITTEEPKRKSSEAQRKKYRRKVKR